MPFTADSSVWTVNVAASDIVGNQTSIRTDGRGGGCEYY